MSCDTLELSISMVLTTEFLWYSGGLHGTATSVTVSQLKVMSWYCVTIFPPVSASQAFCQLSGKGCQSQEEGLTLHFPVQQL